MPQKSASQKNLRTTRAPRIEAPIAAELLPEPRQSNGGAGGELASGSENSGTPPAGPSRTRKPGKYAPQEQGAAHEGQGTQRLIPTEHDWLPFDIKASDPHLARVAAGRRRSDPPKTGAGRPTKAEALIPRSRPAARFVKTGASATEKSEAPARRNSVSPKPGKSGKARAEVLGSLLEGIEEGVAHVSTGGVVLYANARFAELFGARPDQMGEGRTTLKDFLSPTCWNDLEAGLRQAAQKTTEGVLNIEDAAHSIVRTVRLLLSPVYWKKATTIKITAAETTELVEKNRALQDKEASLHALSARILQLQDEERRRIARDLHDITGQELAVVIMALSQLANHYSGPGADVQQKITDAAGLVRKIEDEIRTLSYVLHPPLLDEFGLGSALNWYAEGFTKRSGIEVEVEVVNDLPRLKPEKEMALFRVVQEGMTNVLRHSGSKKARIRVSFDAEYVALSVEDEGRGIERGKLSRPGGRSPDSGVGIAGMRERLQQLGGRLDVRRKEKGTEVAAMIPIGDAAPIEEPPSEADILRMAEALGYKGQSSETNGAPAAAKKRVLIADDHEVTRQGIRSLLKDEGDIEICGEAKDGLEAVVKARELDPDLVIMDLTMPRTGGFSAANRIRRLGGHTRILFFTTHASPEMERMSRAAGFEGYVQKADGARDLVRGVRAVLAGKKFYSADVAKKGEATGSSSSKQKASTQQSGAS